MLNMPSLKNVFAFLVVAYRNVEEIVDAMKSRKVDGALLDMYATAVRKDLFVDKDIQINRFVEYPSGYGIVLSGRLKDSSTMMNSYLQAHKTSILKLIDDNTNVISEV